jgi:hypothetical protein
MQTIDKVPSAAALLSRNADADRVTLLAKAAAELLEHGQSAESANRQLQQLWDVLETLL